MVRAYHCIFGMYGFWLPNDPRGSWSDYIRAWELYRYGAATKVSSRQSSAHLNHDWRARDAAKKALRHPPVVLGGHQALSVAKGFAVMIATAGYVVHACSILPDHVHMVARRHHYRIEQIVGRLKGKASEQLAADARHPFQDLADSSGRRPSPWARKGWNVYLNTDRDICRAVTYVEQNPVKEGKQPQRWSFVTPFGL